MPAPTPTQQPSDEPPDPGIDEDEAPPSPPAPGRGRGRGRARGGGRARARGGAGSSPRGGAQPLGSVSSSHTSGSRRRRGAQQPIPVSSIARDRPRREIRPPRPQQDYYNSDDDERLRNAVEQRKRERQAALALARTAPATVGNADIAEGQAACELPPTPPTPSRASPSNAAAATVSQHNDLPAEQITLSSEGVTQTSPPGMPRFPSPFLPMALPPVAETRTGPPSDAQQPRALCRPEPISRAASAAEARVAAANQARNAAAGDVLPAPAASGRPASAAPLRVRSLAASAAADAADARAASLSGLRDHSLPGAGHTIEERAISAVGLRATSHVGRRLQGPIADSHGGAGLLARGDAIEHTPRHSEPTSRRSPRPPSSEPSAPQREPERTTATVCPSCLHALSQSLSLSQQRILVFVTAAGCLPGPGPFVRSEVFIARSPADSPLPNVRRLLKMALSLPEEWSSARLLVERSSASCGSAEVYSVDTLIPSDFRLSTESLTPPGSFTLHGTLTHLLSSSTPPIPLPCTLPSSPLDLYRAQLCPESPNSVPVVHLFIVHFMLRDPQLEPLSQLPARTRSSVEDGRSVHLLSHRAGEILHQPVASSSGVVLDEEPMIVDAVSTPRVPSRSLTASPNAIPTLATELALHEPPPPLIPSASEVIRRQFHDVAADIAHCMDLARPNRRGALAQEAPLAPDGTPFMYGTAYASWRIWAHVLRICQSLGLDIYRPTLAHHVRLPGTLIPYTVTPRLVAKALGVPIGTWQNLKTRFRDLDAVAARIDRSLAAAAPSSDHRNDLLTLKHNLSFYLADVKIHDPRSDPRAYAHEYAIRNWQTGDFEATMSRWMVE